MRKSLSFDILVLATMFVIMVLNGCVSSGQSSSRVPELLPGGPISATELYNLTQMEKEGFTLDAIRSKVLTVVLSSSRYDEFKSFINASQQSAELGQCLDNFKQNNDGDYSGDIVLRKYVKGKFTTNVCDAILKFFVYGRDLVILKTPALGAKVQLEALKNGNTINIVVGAYRTRREHPEYVTKFSATASGYRLTARDPGMTDLIWSSGADIIKSVK